MGNDPANGTDPTGGFTEPFSTLGNVVVTAKAKAGTTIKGLTTGQTILSTTTTVFRYTNKFFGGDVFETPKDLGNFHVDETNQVWHRLGDAGSQGGTLGTLTEYKPDFFDRWSESNNFFAKLGYGIVDGGGLFIQALTPGVGHANAYHLNGSGANPTEVTEGGVGTMGMLLPGGAGGRYLGGLKVLRPTIKVVAPKVNKPFVVEAIKLSTSSKSLAPSRHYTIFDGSGNLYKFGVTDANLFRYGQSLMEAGPGAYGKFSSVMPKYQAHLGEKYLRSLFYNSTGQYALPGMKIPYPVNFNTGLPIKP
jgi:hypothetical protein